MNEGVEGNDESGRWCLPNMAVVIHLGLSFLIVATVSLPASMSMFI